MDLESPKRVRKNVSRLSTETVASSNYEKTASMIVDGEEHPLIEICATGNIVLDVTFENSKTNVRMPAIQPGNPKPKSLLRGVKSPNIRIMYRVTMETLAKNSKYFEMLLLNENFAEALRIKRIFDDSKAQGIDLTEATTVELPRITVRDEDDATRVAGRELVFGDLLRILHSRESIMRWTLMYSAIMAIMADLYDCTASISRYMRASKKMSWPNFQGSVTPAVEEAMRQKILISWLLDDPVRLAIASKDLILRGSSRWTNDNRFSNQKAIWWDLPDSLENELHYRRSCILSVVWSLLKHFIKVYSSKERQCKYFYESSSSCDSFSLGEIIKFLLNKNLMLFISPLSVEEEYPAIYGADIESLIQILRQCPSYQIDANHRHCGMRSRIIPALDYIQSMLTSNIGIDRRGWKADRFNTSWENNDTAEVFRFTKRLSNDQRLKLDGLIVGNRHARTFFTASNWDWNPEEPDDKHDPNAKLGRAFGSMSGL